MTYLVLIMTDMSYKADEMFLFGRYLICSLFQILLLFMWLMYLLNTSFHYCIFT